MKSVMPKRLLSALAVCPLFMAFAWPALAAITADHADDVCAPSADPCDVTAKIDIVDGATLDFGTRTVHLKNGGQFDFGTGSASVLCGDLTMDSWGNGARIEVKDSVTGQGMVGGSGKLVARGRCSADAAVPCLHDGECADASAGTCTGASGAIVLDDNVRGDANPAGRLSFEAYDSFTSSGAINLRNGGQGALEVEGGELEIKTWTGSITVNGRIELNGGSQAQGGSFFLSAGDDVNMNSDVDATGGDGGGGLIHFDAKGNVNVSDDLNAASDIGQGIGGQIIIRARNNVVLTGISAGNRTVLSTKGHADSDFAGNGGSIEIQAVAAINVGAHVRLRSDGPAQDGEAGQIDLNACHVTVSADAILDANGTEGGAIELSGSASLTVDPNASVDASGTSEDSPGAILLLSRVAGTCDNNPTKECSVDADCTVGCTTYPCNTSLDTGGVTTQFSPEPDIGSVSTLPNCE